MFSLCIHPLAHILMECLVVYVVLLFWLFAQAQNPLVLGSDFASRMSLVRTKCCIVNVLGQLRKVWIDALFLASLCRLLAHSLVCWLWQCWRELLQWLWRRCGDKQVWKFTSLRNGPINRFKCVAVSSQALEVARGVLNLYPKHLLVYLSGSPQLINNSTPNALFSFSVMGPV